MWRYSKNFKIIFLALFLFFIILIGGTYAFFAYSRVSVQNKQLIAGNIYMHYKESSHLSIENTIPQEEYISDKYFEFAIDGVNTSNNDIYYEVMISHGDEHSSKTERIRDEFLKFRLVEVIDNEEKVLLDKQSYSEISETRIWVDTINGNQKDEIIKTYRLYMWIGNNILIGVGENVDYDMDTWNNDLYASIKVSVSGDFKEKKVPVNFVETIKKKYGTDASIVAVNTNGLLYDSSDSTQLIREYRYSGANVNNYVVFNDDGDDTKNEDNELWRIIGIFKEYITNEDGSVILDGRGNPMYEERIKLVRNKVLNDSEFPSSYIIDGTTYTISNGTSAYWNYASALRSANYNDWTEAGIKYYLNTFYDDTDTSDGISVANNGYLSLLNEKSLELIADTTYYLGNVTSNDLADDDTTVQAYNNERGNVMCASGLKNESYASNCNVWYGNKATWKGKIGLIYPSDYGYSGNSSYWASPTLYYYDSEAMNTSWMYMTMNLAEDEWLISPSAYSINYVIPWREDYIGYYYSRSSGTVTKAYGVRPTFYLKSSTRILDGEGSENDPYVVIVE